MKFCTDLHSTLVCWCVVSIAANCCPFWKESLLEILHLRASRVSPFDGELVQAEKEASLVTSEVCALLTCGSTLRNAWSWRQPLHCTIPDGHSQLHPADWYQKARRLNWEGRIWGDVGDLGTSSASTISYYIYLYLLKLCAILPLLKTWLVVRANPFLSSQRPTISRLGSERWTWMILDSMLSTLFLLASMLATPVIRFDHIRSHSIHRPWNFLKLIFIR